MLFLTLSLKNIRSVFSDIFDYILVLFWLFFNTISQFLILILRLITMQILKIGVYIIYANRKTQKHAVHASKNMLNKTFHF